MDATKKQKLLDKSKEEYTSCTSKKAVDSCVGIEHYIKKIIPKIKDKQLPISRQSLYHGKDFHVRHLWTI